MRILLLLIMSLLFSCATDVPTSQITKQSPPFLKRYKKKSKELLYVVTKNEKIIDEELRELIWSNVSRFDPEIVITMIDPENKKGFEKDLNSCELNENCDLAAWTCQHVRPHGIPCVGGDPYESDILAEGVRRGMTSDDILFFRVYRRLYLERGQNKRNLDSLPDLIRQEADVLNTVTRMNKESFLQDYREKMDQKQVVLTKENLKPLANGNYLQKMAFIVRQSRESLIIGRIRKEQLAHERVMVIYTHDHYKHHLAPLEKFFSTELP